RLGEDRLVVSRLSTRQHRFEPRQGLRNASGSNERVDFSERGSELVDLLAYRRACRCDGRLERLDVAAAAQVAQSISGLWSATDQLFVGRGERLSQSGELLSAARQARHAQFEGCF